MDNIIKIESYLDNEARITKQRKSPVLGICILIAGIAVLLVSIKWSLPDAPRMIVLSLGALGALVGFIMAIAACISQDGSYIYQPTHSKLKHYRRYINADDRQLLCDCLSHNQMKNLSMVRQETSTGHLLQAYISADGAFAVLQLETYIPHDFVPATEVVSVMPEEISTVWAWIK